MPAHDWTRVDAGTFHAFHNAWITHLSEALNAGILPEGYYALAEQHAGRLIADLLTLQAPSSSLSSPPAAKGGLAVAEASPRVRRRLSASPTLRHARRSLSIRHVSGHRLIALVEIVSPANKDRAVHVRECVDKVEAALLQGVHVLLIDLFPPGTHDPRGLHGALWERFDDAVEDGSSAGSLTLASYVAGRYPEAYVENLDVAAPLAEMPLFLSPERYVPAPLEPTYQQAYSGFPSFWRNVVEG